MVLDVVLSSTVESPSKFLAALGSRVGELKINLLQLARDQNCV